LRTFSSSNAMSTLSTFGIAIAIECFRIFFFFKKQILAAATAVTKKTAPKATHIPARIVVDKSNFPGSSLAPLNEDVMVVAGDSVGASVGAALVVGGSVSAAVVLVVGGVAAVGVGEGPQYGQPVDR